MERQAGLDFVRTIAIAWVLLRHAWMALDADGKAQSTTEHIAANGWLGVDLFFALSGFLIARSFWNKDDVREFLLHRIARIVPAYFCTIFLIAVAPSALSSDPNMVSALEIIEHLIFVNDYTGSDLIVAFWSLAVEMKFYVLCSFLFFFFRRCQRITAGALFLALACVGIVIRATEAAAAGPELDYNSYFQQMRSPMHVSMDGLFFGVAAGTWMSCGRLRKGLSLAMFWVGGLALFGIGALKQWMVTPDSWEVTCIPAAASLAATLLVVGASQWQLIPAKLGFRAAAELAFPIYLVHMAAIPWAASIMTMLNGSLTAFTVSYLAATLALAIPLHFGIERPAHRRLLNRFGNPQPAL